MNLTKTDTTRYLCAAAYLSPTFRDSVIQLIFKEDCKDIAICHGVDLSTVLKHCLAAQKRELNKHKFLAFIFLLACVSVLLPNDEWVFIFILCFLLALILVFSEAWKLRYEIIAKTLAKSNFDPNYINLTFTQNEKIKLEEIARKQNSNIIVYGGYSPFVGCGFELGGWSFVLNISKGKEIIEKTLTPIPFAIEELYEYVVNRIRELKLSELSIEDKLCVNGQEIRGNSVLLPDIFSRPSSQVDDKYVKSFVNATTEHIRYYKHIKVITWQGELVLSVFLRIRKINQQLFIETNFFVLCPVKNEYYLYLVDAIEPEITIDKLMSLLISSVLETVLLWPLSILNIWNKANSKKQLQQQRKTMRRIIRETPNYNYGAINSVRELASPSIYNQYFQQLDQEMYLKIIERQIIDSICNFLENKNIDTSDLKNRQNAIFNQGVILSGGSIKATNLSVGEQAKSVLMSGDIAPFMPKM
ncbi:MAG: hypothetical protein KME46_32940 [Brasilonema angustatum HA4187-MV1]|jgi:hypothetical protein|nr:hypothetical protein [Brasilonema angustatum HA4187-MV1]